MHKLHFQSPRNMFEVIRHFDLYISYYSWEKGSNEPHDRLVRRFIAKGERISDYVIDAIARIENWCNNLSHKILGYRTSDELFEAKLDEIYSD